MPPLSIQATLERFADAFHHFLDEEIIPYIQDISVKPLAEPMIYALRAPGKRIRPSLVLLCAGVPPEPEENIGAYYTAAAVESIHTYSLIHDDLPAMDDDAMRRGQPACHVQYSEWAAILAGDGLNTLAFELLAKAVCHDPELDLSALVLSLAKGAGMQGMIAGQSLDLSTERSWQKEHSKNEQIQAARDIHNKKTAALFTAACEMGGQLSGCEDLSPYSQYGQKLGLLFQIKDDLLDRHGDPHRMGKAARKDIDKLSYPNVLGVKESQAECERLQSEVRSLAMRLPGGPRTKQSYARDLERLPAFIFNREA